MKNIAMSKLLIALLLAIGLLSIQAQAFDLGKALEDAARQTIENSKKSEEVKNGGEEPAPVAAPAQPATVNTQTPVAASTAPPSAQAEFNWKNPSKAEEIALGRGITGSLLGAAPLVKDEALQKYVNQVGRWVANQSERADLPWKFGVIDSADLNAFAAPGGDRKSVV